MSTIRRYGWLFRIVCCIILLVAGCAEHGDFSIENESEPRRDWVKEMWGKRHTWPDRLWDDSVDTFTDSNNLWLLGITGAASIVMHNSSADDDIQDSVEDNRVIDGFFSESLNIVGGPAAHFAVTGLWYALSVNNNDKLNEDRAWTMMTALSINGLATVGLKAARNNKNPNGDNWAWPSGHTSSSFTVAAVLDEFYGPKVGIPAYALATMVAYRMVEEGDHWMSDAVFGAALGWAVGHTVAGKHKKLELAGFDVVPMTVTTMGKPASGLNLVKKF